MPPLEPLFRQFVTFCGVGVINTAAGLGMILFLSEIAGLQYMVANAGGYAFGLIVAFILHRSVTFRANSAQGRMHTQFGMFLLVFAVCYGVQLGALYGMVEILMVPKILAQILAIGVYTAVNFLGSRFLVFNHK